jgi:hypothetical protein
MKYNTFTLFCNIPPLYKLQKKVKVNKLREATNNELVA